MITPVDETYPRLFTSDCHGTEYVHGTWRTEDGMPIETYGFRVLRHPKSNDGIYTLHLHTFKRSKGSLLETVYPL